MDEKKMTNEEELDKVAGGKITNACIRNACNYEASYERCLACPMATRILPNSDGTALYKCSYGIPGYWNQ